MLIKVKKNLFYAACVFAFVAATTISCDKSSVHEPVDYWIVNVYNSTVSFEEFKGFNKKGEIRMSTFEDEDGEEIFVVFFETPDFEENKVCSTNCEYDYFACCKC